MESNKIMLLFQLINGLDEAFSIFEKSYNESNKEKFDSSKKAILDLSNKINYVLK